MSHTDVPTVTPTKLTLCIYIVQIYHCVRRGFLSSKRWRLCSFRMHRSYVDKKFKIVLELDMVDFDQFFMQTYLLYTFSELITYELSLYQISTN
jgi:hypothetical protein